MTVNFFKRILPILIIIGLFSIIWLSGVLDYFSLETIRSERAGLLTLVRGYPVLSIICFILLYILAVALSLPIATLLTLLGGFLFGRWIGTLVIVFAATSGATILFLAARSAIGTSLRERAGPLYHRVAANMSTNAIGYMLFMRLVPLFPFFLVNIVPALFNIRLVPYIATTFIGIIPGTFVYANVGRELGTLQSASDLVSPATLLSFALLGLFALLPTLYRQLRPGEPPSS